MAFSHQVLWCYKRKKIVLKNPYHLTPKLNIIVIRKDFIKRVRLTEAKSWCLNHSICNDHSLCMELFFYQKIKWYEDAMSLCYFILPAREWKPQPPAQETTAIITTMEAVIQIYFIVHIFMKRKSLKKITIRQSYC